LAEIHLGEADVATIGETMAAIGARRQELAAENPRQVFAGITTGEEHSNRLLVVDLNDTGAESPQYVVRTSPIAGENTGNISEEYIPDDDAHRTDYRGPRQQFRHRHWGLLLLAWGLLTPGLEMEKHQLPWYPTRLLPMAGRYRLTTPCAHPPTPK
jgi:hypothetical protein